MKTQANQAREYMQSLEIFKQTFTREGVCQNICVKKERLGSLFIYLKDNGYIKPCGDRKHVAGKGLSQEYVRVKDIKQVFNNRSKPPVEIKVNSHDVVNRFIYSPVMQVRSDVRYNGSHAEGFGSSAYV